MYTAFYGLREKPFALTPNPRFLYLADSHREAMAHLQYGLEQGEGFIVISGEVGTGKTTLCRSLLERLDGETEVAILFNPSRNPSELLQSINEEFGLPVEGRSRRQLLSALNAFLLEKSAQGHRAVLIIDEAQNLSPGTLEQVRLLSNLETNSSKLIQIILLGQPELDEKLDGDDLRQLRQRISVRWCLEPLPLPDTIGYVKHRLSVAAGAERDIFSAAALREIHRRSGGVPRVINVLCDRVLLAGYAAGLHRIGPKEVRAAARELPEVARRRQPIRPPRAVYAAAASLLALLLGWGLLRGNADEEAPPPAAPAERESLPPVAAAPPEPERSFATAEPPRPAQAAVVVARRAPAPTPLRDDEAWLGVPSEPGDRAGVGLAEDEVSSEAGQGLFLAALLSGQDPLAALELSMNAVLERWDLPPLAARPGSLDDALDLLPSRYMTSTLVSGGDLAELRRLGYPALLRLRAGSGETRVVALVALDGQLADLMGVRASGSLRVPVSAVEEQWDGEAVVIWRPYVDLPEVVGMGQQGAAVAWIQEALEALGDLPSGVSGRYDEDTALAVQAFQRRHRLTPDGVAGPQTQMLIYAELDEFDPPRLARGEAG